MSDSVADEKAVYDSGSSQDGDSKLAGIFERPKGLRGIYRHPITQVCLLGLTCFLCPGMFNALTGLGGGGQMNATTEDNANSALYATMAFTSFFAGSVNNHLGPRLTLQLGTFGYALYVGSYLAINIHPNAGAFVVAAGAILGITAGLLWTAQGALLLGYATEAEKGRFIGIFWAIFNLGGVVGSAISFGQNFKSTSNGVANGTYIGFLILTLVGTTIPMLMVSPATMIRTDGTKVPVIRRPSWKVELWGLWVALWTDPYILLLFPMFFASNYFYTWQFNDYNSALFDIRARGLNNFTYWLSQIFGSIFIGLILDSKRIRRRVRAFTGWTILLAMAFIVHIWAYFYQRTYTRESVALMTTKMDIYDSAYPAHVWLMIFYGLFDAMWQTVALWLIGAMSNDPGKIGIFAGFYHGIQSAGAAGVWRTDAVDTPYMNIFISTWCLVAAGLIIMFPMIYMRVKDHTQLEEEALVRMDDAGHIQKVEDIAL